MMKPGDDRHEFKPLLVEIEEGPLNPLGRTVFWLVLAAFLSALLWMICGQVDVVVTARGRVIPSGEIKTIQPLGTGVVRSILIQPGDYVTRGQILLELDPSDVDPELGSMQRDLMQAELEIERIGALLSGRPFRPEVQVYDAETLRVQVAIHASERELLQRQIRGKQESLAQLNERVEAEKKVLEQAGYMFGVLSGKLGRLEKVRDLISHDEYEEIENEARLYLSEQTVSKHRLTELRALKKQVAQEIALTKEKDRNRLLAELSEISQRHSYLEAQIEKAEFVSTRCQIRAPVDGHISQLFVHTIGGIVTPAEKLAHIVPSGSPLLIKSRLQNQDAGFVAKDMPASIKVDAFNFQKYGILEAKVVQISRDSIEDERQGLVYETYLEPLQSTLTVEGVETAILPGMSVTAEVKVGKRRIIEFFLYPLVKYLDEGLSVR